MKFSLGAYKKNTKYIALGSLGGWLSITGYLIYILNPLQIIIDKLLVLQPGSFLFKLWKEPPYEVLAKIYVFNVTNFEQFQAGKEKLNFSEIGPFVYQEILKNTEPTFNDNGTLTFKPRRELVFRRDESIGDPDTTMILTPNVPLLGISSYVKEEYGLFMNLGFSTLINVLESPSVKNLTITEYLFGYSDPLINMASKYVPSWIDFSKFGILDRLMSIENGNNTITMHLKGNSTNTLPLSINKFNGSPGLKQWGYEVGGVENSICNTVEGTFDNPFFPRHLKENTTIRLYRRAFCRPIPFNYKATNYTSTGIKYYDYTIDQNFLSKPEENSENLCYCKGLKECLPNGFGSLAPCYYGIPIVLSQPHYLNGDPKILAQVDGLKPDQQKHDTMLKMHADFGIPLSAQLRVQVNLKVVQNQIVSQSKPFQGLMLPLLWIDLNVPKVPSDVDSLLNLAIIMPTVQIIVACILGLLGGAVIAITTLWGFRESARERMERWGGRTAEYSPVLILPPEVGDTKEYRKFKWNVPKIED